MTIFCATPARAQFPPDDAPAAPRKTQPPPEGAKVFQPNVAIDWKQKRVLVDGVIALREGPLEYFACFPGKAHESVVEMTATAQNVYLALGLIGLTPGTPSQWDESTQRFSDPTGDLVDVSVEWQDGKSPRRVDAFDWILRIEYAKPSPGRPFVFAGSRAAGTLRTADKTGSGIALVQDPHALLALSHNRSDRNADLWAQARSSVIPPAGTPVRVVFQAAAPRKYAMRFDFRGEIFVDDLLVEPDEAAELISAQRRIRADFVQEIRIEPGLQSDRLRLLQNLEKAGVARDAFNLIDVPKSAGAPASQPSSDK